MTIVRGLIALAFGGFCSKSLFAAVIYSGGWVETRAYSGFTPEVPTVKDHQPVDDVPFVDTTSLLAGGTVGNMDYALSASASGAAFRWDFAQIHDGGFGSYTIAEGELRFQVDATTDFELAGDYAYSGMGSKHARFWLYDTLQDSNPVLQWQSLADGDDAGEIDLTGKGELSPGVNYRLVYRIMLDNPHQGDVGATAGVAEFLIGEPVSIAQPGDADGNGRVDLVDLNLVRNNFGATGGTVLGDTVPFDGKVDLADLNAVRNHFGESLPTSVPEPVTGVLIGAGIVALLAGRGIRKR
jgi:hypothetical protein